MNKKLKQSIEKKLESLQEILGQIAEAQIVDPNDSDTWDSDALYNLAEQLKEALQLLENEETGICWLLDDWETNQEDENL